MFLLSLACVGVTDTDDEPQDSDTAVVRDCPVGQVSADPASVVVNSFIVDGLPIYGVAESICVGEDGLSVDATLDIDGESARLQASSEELGSINLPDDQVELSLTQDKVWMMEDVFAGTLTLTTSGDELLGDLQFEATNGDDAQITFGMSWAAEL